MVQKDKVVAQEAARDLQYNLQMKENELQNLKAAIDTETRRVKEQAQLQVQRSEQRLHESREALCAAMREEVLEKDSKVNELAAVKEEMLEKDSKVNELERMLNQVQLDKTKLDKEKQELEEEGDALVQPLAYRLEKLTPMVTILDEILKVKLHDQLQQDRRYEIRKYGELKLVELRKLGMPLPKGDTFCDDDPNFKWFMEVDNHWQKMLSGADLQGFEPILPLLNVHETFIFRGGAFVAVKESAAFSVAMRKEFKHKADGILEYLMDKANEVHQNSDVHSGYSLPARLWDKVKDCEMEPGQKLAFLLDKHKDASTSLMTQLATEHLHGQR